MLPCMVPSSPLPWRTFHLLFDPDISCANDTGPFFSCSKPRAMLKAKHDSMSDSPILPITSSLLKDYFLDHAYDEMCTPEGGVRSHYNHLLEVFAGLPPEELRRRKQSAD